MEALTGMLTWQPPLACSWPPESESPVPPLAAPPQLLAAVPLLARPAGNVSVNASAVIGTAFGFESDTVSVEFAPATTDPGEKDFVTVGPGAAATVREAVLEAALDTATAATEPLIAPAAVDTP